MSDFDKLLANLRLGTDELSKDVDKAVAQIDKLNKKAEQIDEAFAGGTSSTGGSLKQVTAELLEVSKNMTKVSKDIADKYEATAKRVKTAQVSMMETIKHNVQTNKQSYDEAYTSAKKYHDMLKQQYTKEVASNKGKAMNASRYGKDISEYKPYDTEATKRQLMEVEKYMAELNASMEKAREKATAEAKKAFTEELNNKRALYDTDKASYKEHLEELLQLDKYSSDERIAIEKELVSAKKAIANLDESEAKKSNSQKLTNEKEFRKKSKQLVDEAFVFEKTKFKGNYQDFKEYCEKLLNTDKLTTEQQLRLRNKLAQAEKNDARQREKDLRDRIKLEKQATDQLNRNLTAKQPMIDKNSPVQKFDNITNYAFDATLIYGAVNAVRMLSTEMVDLEANMVNLQRVAPNLSNFQVDEITDGLINIAGETNNTVANVQDIANYWVRVSDEIANSSELLTYLTDVTSVAMNVGGFESADEAVQLLSASINQMGLEWKDAGTVLDGWMKMADETAVGSAKDLADNVLRTGTQAQMLGLDINQLNAVMGIFANNMAKSGEEVGTAMKTVFSYFTDPKAIDTLYKHGVQVMANAEEYRNFADVMVDLQLKYKELERDGNDVAIREMNNALGRTRRVDYVGTLINNFDQFDDMLRKSVDSAGYAGEQNEKMMQTLQAEINKLKVSFIQLAKGLSDSGMMDDFKTFVQFAIKGMDAINNMDDTTKRFLLTLTELTGAYVVLQKSSKLMFGAEFTNGIANATAKLALMTKNQTLLNMAVASGAKVEAVSATATVVETTSITANTGAKALNNAESVKGNIIGQAEIIQSGQQAVANTTEAGTYVAVASAKMKANTSAGLLTSGISALTNPVGIAIGAVALLTAGFVALRKSQEDARIEAERFADAQAVLAEKVAVGNSTTGVLDDFGISEYEGLISKLDSAKLAYDESIAKVEELRAKQAELMKEQASIAGDGAYAKYSASPELAELNKELYETVEATRDYENQLREMGSTTQTVTDDISALEVAVARSGDAEQRSSMDLINKIGAMQSQNDETRSLISQYHSLASITDRSIEQNEALQRAVAILSATFPALSITTDDASGAIAFNTNAMRESIGMTGQLTNAQYNEILSMAGVSQNAKTLALNTINAEIKKTTTVIDQAQLRIDAYQAEAKAMGATNTSRIKVQSAAHKPLSLSAFGKEMMSNNLIGAKYSNDNFAKASTVKRVTDLSANIRNTQNELLKAEATLRNLEAQKNAVSKYIPFENHNTSVGKKPYVPESIKKANSKAEADREKALRDAERDREEAQRALEELAREAERLMQERERSVLNMQGKIVNALKTKYNQDKTNRLKALKEMEEAEVKVYDERIKKLRDEIEALQDTREDERNNIDSLKKNLVMWKRDESEYGKRKVRELEKQLAEEEKNLLIKNKELEITSLEDQKQGVLDLYEARKNMDSEHYDSQLKAIENASQEVNLYKQANELINGNVTAQQKILDLLKEYAPEYASIGQLMGQSLADSMMTEVKEAMSAVTALELTGTSETPPPASGSSSSPAPSTPNPSTPKPSTPTPAPKPSEPSVSAPPIRKGYSSKGEKLSPTSSLIDYMKSKGYYSTLTDRKAIYDYYAGKGILPKGTYTGTGSQNSAMWTRLKKDGYDTGGYTGSWGESGKLAMLHQKERVLNAQQTKAFESLVYNFLPKLNLGKSIDSIGKSAGTIINNNAPLIQNDIKITNNTPFDVSNKMDNLNRAIKAELHQIGYNRSVGGRR